MGSLRVLVNCAVLSVLKRRLIHRSAVLSSTVWPPYSSSNHSYPQAGQLVQLNGTYVLQRRRVHDKSKKDDERQFLLSSQLSDSVSADHVPFQDEQRIIQDVIDQVWESQPETQDEEEEEVDGPEAEKFPRGKTGVIDLADMVDLLRNENAEEIVAITIPKELDYADWMIIVTVRSNRHLLGLATFVRKRFKMTHRKSTDRLPYLEKKRKYDGWIALDLGNIILHIFEQEVRDYYDLEMLWTVGPVFDDLFNAKDPEIVQLLNAIK